MKKLTYIISILSILFFFSIGNNAIANAHVPTKVPDKSFKISSKSKTIFMEKGDNYRIKAKLRENRYYFFSACCKKKEGCLQYRIIDAETDEILFDNSVYEFENNVTFLNDEERNVIIELRTMPCYKNMHKESKIKVLFANKKIKEDNDYEINFEGHLYAVL
jgi:hypothetical protein